MAQIDELRWQVMTGIIEDIKVPNIFLKKLLYSNEQPQEVENIRIETIGYGRKIAPFVRKNGEGIMVPGFDGSSYSVEAPNIRIKRPLTPSGLLFNRPLGSGVLFNPARGAVRNNVRQQITKDLRIMEYMISNAEEYLCAMSLQGSISYVQADQDAFTITYPRSSSNNISMSVFLDDGTPANINLPGLILSIKSIVSKDGSPQITDAICGEQAGTQLMTLAAMGKLPGFNTQANNAISIGTLTFANQFRDDGAILLGEIAGVRFWMYGRDADLNGTTVPMIRTKYIEFVSSNSAAAERVMYYGAILDMTALMGNTYAGTRFSKSWLVEDPSAYMSLAHSRPLPVPRRPNASVSVKAISG